MLVYGVAAAMVRDTAHSAGDGGETPPSVVHVCQNQKREEKKNKKKQCQIRAGVRLCSRGA